MSVAFKTRVFQASLVTTFRLANFSVSLKSSALNFLTGNGANLFHFNFGCYFHLELLHPLRTVSQNSVSTNRFKTLLLQEIPTEAADLEVL